MSNKAVALSEVKIGQKAQVRAVDVEDSMNQRLMAFGLMPGAEISVVHVAPLGDPIAISFNSQKVMIRRSDAVRVQVELISK